MFNTYLSDEKKEPQLRVIGFSGSPRINGNSDILLKEILSGIKEEKVPTESFNLSKINFKGCLGCEKCRKDKICTGQIDGMTALYPQIYSARGLVLVSPTHNYNVTSWMKAFIDRLYCFYNFSDTRPGDWSSQFNGQNRKAVVVAICEQESKKDIGFTLEGMKEPLKALGYEITTEMTVLKTFKKADVKKNEKTMEEAFEAGKKIALALK